MSAPPLEFLDVGKWYGPVAALIDVSFQLSVERGSILGLVGQNGAGKSTIMKLATGLVQPSHGQVRVFGKPPSQASTRRLVGHSPDIEALHERQTGHAFVAWMLRLHGLGLRESRQRAGDLLTRLGLGDAMHDPVRTYSKGMRQRVRLAQCLGHEPPLILLDEPMTGLDPVARHELAELLRELVNRDGRSVVISSHVLHELEHTVDEVLFIHRGQVLARGAVAKIRRELANRPHRVRVASDVPRELSAALIRLECVRTVELEAAAVSIETDGSDELYRQLAALGASKEGMVRELAPIDDDLGSVFGYLVAQ